MSRDLKIKLRYVIEVERFASSNDPAEGLRYIVEREGLGEPKTAVVTDAYTGDALLVMADGHLVARKLEREG